MLIFASLIATTFASGYGKSGVGGYSGKGGAAVSFGGSSRSGTSGGISFGGVSGVRTAAVAGQVIPAAIQTLHNIEFRDVPSTGSVAPTTVEVSSN